MPTPPPHALPPATARRHVERGRSFAEAARIAPLLFALFMGFTGVAVAVHYPADVTASVVVAGWVSTAATHFRLLPRATREDAGPRPVAARGGNGRD